MEATPTHASEPRARSSRRRPTKCFGLCREAPQERSLPCDPCTAVLVGRGSCGQDGPRPYFPPLEAMMPESAFFSGVSAIIPLRADEDRDWVTELVRTARGEASEVLIVIERGVDPLSVRPALGSSERTKILMQRGDT